MLKLIKALIDVDDPPKPFGWPGLVIMAVFLIFCALMWVRHSAT